MNLPRVLLTTYLICGTLLCFGQFERQAVIPPTPEAASLGKFGDVPVSLYTGIPNISIPITTVVVGEIKVPISIDYHAGGIRVDEVASSVGLGWALNAGGTMSRRVNGLWDFKYMTYGDFRGINRSTYDPTTLVFNEDSPPNPDYLFARDVLKGLADGEPDDYFYNFCGRSGQLLYKSPTQVYPIPFDKLKISPPCTTCPNTTATVITDEAGVKYIFGNNEELMHIEKPNIYAYTDQQLLYTPVSHLSRIESPTGRWVNFEYIGFSYSYIQSITQTDYTKLPNMSGCESPPFNGYQPVNCTNTAIVDIGQFIKKITTDDGTVVEFIYASDYRKDLPGTKAVTEIKISNNGKLLKNFVLSTSYFESINIAANLTDPDYYRLKLDAITESGKPPYQFTYKYGGDIRMPERKSFEQDYWGYYNGIHANTTLLPKIRPAYNNYIEIDGANREPDATYMDYLTLTDVKYPTSGKTSFEFKANEYTIPPNVPTGRVLFEDGSFGNNSVGTDPPTVFQVPANAVNLQFIANATCQNFDGCLVKLILASNPEKYMQWALDAHTTQRIETIEDNPAWPSSALGVPIAGNSFYVDFDEGDCECSGALKWSTITNEVNNTPTSITVGGLRIEKITSTDSESGRKNIKRYDYTDPETGYTSGITPYLKPTFDYKYQILNADQSDPGVIYDCSYVKRSATSITPVGSIKGGAISYKYVSELYGENGENGKTLNEFSFYGDAISDQDVPNISNTSYDFLRGLLMKETKFRYISNNNFTPLSEVVNNYEIKTNTDQLFDYETNPQVNENNQFGIAFRENPFLIRINNLNYYQYKFGYYKKVSAWYYLKNTEIHTFSPSNIAQFNTKKINYYYDNPGHIQQTRIEEILSPYKSKLQFITYPLDYANSSGSIADLKIANIISAPIEMLSITADYNVDQQESSNYKILGGEIYSYKPGGSGLKDQISKFETSVPIPITQFKISNKAVGSSSLTQSTLLPFSQDSRYKTRLTFDGYNAKGNVVSISKTNDISTKYLWGYNFTYPIAEIINSSRSEDNAYTGFETADNNNWTLSSGILNTSDFLTGHASYNIGGGYIIKNDLDAGSTYKVSVWVKDGGSVLINNLSGELKLSRNGWKLYELILTGTTSVTIIGSATIDDLRIHLTNSKMTTYTYDPGLGITSMTDSNNISTFYEYDSYSRLSLIKDESKNIVKKYNYNYKK